MSDQYKEAMNRFLKRAPQGNAIDSEWAILQCVLVQTANEVLVRPTSSSPPVRRALAAFLSASCKFGRPPYNATLLERQELRRRRDASRKNLFVVRREDRLKECATFFGKINDFQPQVRLTRTFGYLKTFKHTNQRRVNSVYIPMGRWLDLIRLQSGNKVGVLSSGDYFPLMPPPTASDVYTKVVS